MNKLAVKEFIIKQVPSNNVISLIVKQTWLLMQLLQATFGESTVRNYDISIKLIQEHYLTVLPVRPNQEI